MEETHYKLQIETFHHLPRNNMSAFNPIPTARSDNDILKHLRELAKLVPDFSVDTTPPKGPRDSTRLATIYELAERTIRVARRRLLVLGNDDPNGQAYNDLLIALKELCRRISSVNFPVDHGNDDYFLQVFQALTTAFARLKLPATAYWLSTRLAHLQLRYFKDYAAFLPVLDAARMRVAKNPGAVKFAVDLAWTLDAALTELQSLPAEQRKAADPLLFEMQQTIELLPASHSKRQLLLDRLEHHSKWVKSPPGELEGWELLAEFKALEESQELNDATVEQFIHKYDALNLPFPSKLHSSFIRRLLANHKTAPAACSAFLQEHGPDVFLPDDYQFHQFKGKKYPALVLRVSRFLSDRLRIGKAKDCDWMTPFLEKGAAISPELKLLQGLYRLALVQDDQTKCRQLAAQMVRQDPNWFKHWDLLADAITDDPSSKLACLSAALLCPVSEPKYLSRAYKKWLVAAQSMASALPVADLLPRIREARMDFVNSETILSDLSQLAAPIKNSIFEDMPWIPAVIFSKGTRKKGVLEIALVLNGQKQLLRTRLEQYPAAIPLKTGAPVEVRIQTETGRPHIVDVRLRPDGNPWDALPPHQAVVIGATDIGNGLRIKIDKRQLVLPANRFPDVQNATPGSVLEVRLAINSRTNLWEPLKAHFSSSLKDEVASLT